MLAVGISFALSALVAYFSTPGVARLAMRIGAVAQPDSKLGGRHIHDKPTPRLGGLAIFAGFTVAIAVSAVVIQVSNWQQLLELWYGALVIVVIGVLDDYFELPAKLKLAGQILAAVIFVATGNVVDWVSNPWARSPFPGMSYIGHWGIPLTIFWLVGITNTMNLIDGLDGLAAGVGSIASVTLLLVAWQEGQLYVMIIAAAAAGAALGFLPYNFNPAQIFMGDTGSMLLGFLLGAVAVQGMLKGATTIALAVPLLALGLPILDTTLAIVRRVIHGKPIFQADKGHLHHRLLALGLNQRQAVLILYFVSGCFGLSAVALADVSSRLVAITLLLVGLGLTLAIGRSSGDLLASQHGSRDVRS
ncbi:MAG: MraY family glycosyltransferase [bacterium]